jgi:sulfur carrier protein ThiS
MSLLGQKGGTEQTNASPSQLPDLLQELGYEGRGLATAQEMP